ncbi:hypothetical protein G9A89_007860 [Geosiphon pyriformis]|nr:hypothetical protein G9A89_007860 [Geosiphon pyriformis]
MAYILIAKLEKFTSKEDNAQVNNNSINRLANTFTTIKQGDNEAVTMYLEHFHKNLCQIQAIQADYFTVPQILNQFICGLHSSIFQCVHPMHSTNLQAAVTNARNFEAAELEANYVQAVNLVMNGSSELDSKLKQFSDSINQKLEGYLVDNYAIYQPPQQYNNLEITNCPQNQSRLSSLSNQPWQQEMHICHYCGKQRHLRINSTNLSTTYLLANSTHYLSSAVPTHLSAAVLGNLSAPTNSNTATELTSKQNSKTKTDTTKLKIVNGGLLTDLQFYGTTIRISTTEFGHWKPLKPKCPTLFKSLDYSRRCLTQQLRTQSTQTTYQQYISSHHN